MRNGKKKKKKREKFVDDGRVIAKMNVNGMPWYTEGESPASQMASQNQEEDIFVSTKIHREQIKQKDEMTFGEKMAMMRGVLAAALLVCSVFGIGMFLFILFCVKVWFA